MFLLELIAKYEQALDKAEKFRSSDHSAEYKNDGRIECLEEILADLKRQSTLNFASALEKAAEAGMLKSLSPLCKNPDSVDDFCTAVLKLKQL